MGQGRVFHGSAEIETGLWTVDKTTAKQYAMKDDHFEWRDEKAASNRRDHGVSFETARDVFKDGFAIEWTDDSHGDTEERFITVGMVENRLLFVSYTLRGERIRIISAREAEPRERRRYHNENQT
jgi:uncharacterized protein